MIPNDSLILEDCLSLRLDFEFLEFLTLLPQFFDELLFPLPIIRIIFRGLLGDLLLIPKEIKPALLGQIFERQMI